MAKFARLRDCAPDIAHSLHFADLLRLAEMKRVAAEIAAREPRIDVLINNAGAMFAKRRLTEDGLERTFALNHMAYFVMTAGLRDRLLASGPARIINTASARAPRRQVGFRRSPIGKELRSQESLWSVEAMQHPIHA
jgi:NAD(P)-dependent dehydrogenase (short-subunit alcohol dehydrogenase family)